MSILRRRACCVSRVPIMNPHRPNIGVFTNDSLDPVEPAIQVNKLGISLPGSTENRTIRFRCNPSDEIRDQLAIWSRGLALQFFETLNICR